MCFCFMSVHTRRRSISWVEWCSWLSFYIQKHLHFWCLMPVVANRYQCEVFILFVCVCAILLNAEKWHDIMFYGNLFSLPNVIFNDFLHPPPQCSKSRDHPVLIFLPSFQSGAVSQGPACDTTWPQACLKSPLCTWFNLPEMQWASLPFW